MYTSRDTTIRIRLAKQILQAIKNDIDNGYKPCIRDVEEFRGLIATAREGIRKDKFNNFMKGFINV